MKTRTGIPVKSTQIEKTDSSKSTITTGQFHENVQYFELKEKEISFNVVDFFEFVFFESGTGWHSVNGIKHNIIPRQVHISFPGQAHLWNANNCSGHRLLLGRLFVQAYFQGISFLMPDHNQFQTIVLDQHISGRFRADLQLLLLEINRPVFDFEIFKLRLELLFNNISIAQKRKTGKHTTEDVFAKIHPVLDQLQQILEKNFKQEKEVRFYAKALFMTTNYLNKLCKRQWGINVKKVIDNRTVTEALRLLVDDSNQSVQEIAASLGFANVSNFSRFLKSRTNYSPSQLRGRLKYVE